MVSLHDRHFRAAFLISFWPIVGVLGACGLVACTHSLRGPKLYEGPRLAPTQIARITHDDYARILKVDEREVSGSEFEVLPGCHTVSIAYAVTVHKTTSVWPESVPSLVRGLLTAKVVQAANTKKTTTTYGSSATTTYETINPIVFGIDMKPSIVYWFKATFNGSDFFPEVVEQDEANRSFPPGVHCPSPQPRDTAR
jgi:hypothetical protein